MWPSVIAVLGTLAGATLTFTFQSRLSRLARAADQQDRRHQEIREACAVLGAALVAYRHSQLARQTHRLRSEGASATDLTEEVRHRRGDAWAAYFRVELLLDDEKVLEPARDAMARIRELKAISSLPQLETDAEDARQSIQSFVRGARGDLLRRQATS